MEKLLYPSLLNLSDDYLKDEVQKLDRSGADILHLDVMDGDYVLNFGQSAYAAAKEGIRGLSRVAATEWGPDGINVNVVCPLAWTAKLE